MEVSIGCGTSAACDGCALDPATSRRQFCVPESTEVTRACIISRRLLRPSVAEVVIEPFSPLDVRAGQFVFLRRDDGLTRPYSVSNLVDADGHIVLHVGRVPGGQMSSWLCDEDILGADVWLGGPGGRCFYDQTMADRSLVLAGTGTGLSPLFGVAQDALEQGHRAAIDICHGARSSDGLYLHGRLEQMSATHAHLSYLPSVLDGATDRPWQVGRIEDTLAASIAGTGSDKCIVFLCGPPETVRQMQRVALDAGVLPRDLYLDPFSG
ncbi:MAG: FAD-binding oxidoreductase [Persicimonas sp.]